MTGHNTYFKTTDVSTLDGLTIFVKKFRSNKPEQYRENKILRGTDIIGTITSRWTDLVITR